MSSNPDIIEALEALGELQEEIITLFENNVITQSKLKALEVHLDSLQSVFNYYNQNEKEDQLSAKGFLLFILLITGVGLVVGLKMLFDYIL